jgi:hypothetical protein
VQYHKVHNVVRDFDNPPKGLEARTLTVCLRPDQWGKVEWLAKHLRLEVDRAATILLTEAVVDMDIETIKTANSLAMDEDIRMQYLEDLKKGTRC